MSVMDLAGLLRKTSPKRIIRTKENIIDHQNKLDIDAICSMTGKPISFILPILQNELDITIDDVGYYVHNYKNEDLDGVMFTLFLKSF